jgi:uncharacterized protein (DUF58 family)
VAVCALVSVLGAWQPILGWAGVVLVLCAVAVVAADGLLLPEARDFVALRVGRPALPLGTEATIAVEVQIRSERHTAPQHLRAVDDLQRHLVRLREPAPTSVALGVPARIETRVRPTKRGAFILGALHVRLLGTLGLAERAVYFPIESEVRVYPGLGEIAAAARVLRQSTKREEGRRRSRLRGQGTAFESLREYVRGDDPRHVDWKASARHDKLISRNYEVERSQTVMLMIDAGRWMTGEVEGLTRLDRVLNACLLLAHVCTRRDDRVGVLLFSDRVHAFVPPGKGRAAVERMLQAVYDVEPRLVESDYRRAFGHLAARHRKRSLLVLFTDVMSRESSRAVMEECRRSARRHLPLAVTLRDTDLDGLARAIPGNASAAYQQAAAEELLLEREQALAIMRASGVHVLDCEPRHLAPAVVDRYLELKARMLL